jgi:serine/threonine protein kinase
VTATTVLATGLARGSQIGGYRIDARIGEGGMGVVYLAEHVLLGRPAAVKVLRAEVSHVPGVVTRFFNEARATTAIRHPGIVEVFDFGYTPDRLAYIVMEWLSGTSMAGALACQPFPLLTALVLMRRIVGALGAAHATGVVHRDLKPDNIFLVADPEGGDIPQVKLLDFGIAKLLDDGLAAPRQTATGVVIGTPVYMSPEQCRAQPCDHRSDLYSLGCVLHEMIAGRPPFEASSAAELLAAHLTTVPAPLDRLVPGVPALVAALVTRLLAKEPEARPGSAAATVIELDRLIATLAPERRTAQQATVLAPRLTGGFSSSAPALRYRATGGLGPAAPALVTSPSLPTPIPIPTPPPPLRRSRTTQVLTIGGAAAVVTAAAMFGRLSSPTSVPAAAPSIAPAVTAPAVTPPPVLPRGTVVEIPAAAPQPDAAPEAPPPDAVPAEAPARPSPDLGAKPAPAGAQAAPDVTTRPGKRRPVDIYTTVKD